MTSACAHTAAATGKNGTAVRTSRETDNDNEQPASPGSKSKRKVLATFFGTATYYSDSLAGNHTASGEIYRPRALTAANRTLPFGTVVRVVRIDIRPRRAVVVRINDRGPFGERKRVLDLSRAAAERLKMISDGVVRVRVEILKYGRPKSRAKR